jgi:hypothetical protein
MRSNEWTEALLAEVYARPNAEPSAWWEQAAFIELARLPGVRERIQVLPNKGLNSYGGGACGFAEAFTEGDFLVHFPGVADKGAAFMRYWDQLPLRDRQTPAAVQ